jgi:hypothetical protein
MTDKEAYIHEWIEEVSKSRPELDGFSICPYASKSKTLIKEVPIDDVVPESGYDVIIFIVEDFWRPDRVVRWVEFYNKKYVKYKFFEDCSGAYTNISGVKTNNEKFNLILCQSKQKLSKIRKKLMETGYYGYWSDEYLKEILGDEYEEFLKISKKGENS